MGTGRRKFIMGATAAASNRVLSSAPSQQTRQMYGLIGKLLATPGHRDALIAILLRGTDSMPGCLSYIVAKDTADENAIWITEVWDTKENHDASLTLPMVRKAIAAARPIIAGSGERFITTPSGGLGLPPRTQ